MTRPLIYLSRPLTRLLTRTTFPKTINRAIPIHVTNTHRNTSPTTTTRPFTTNPHPSTYNMPPHASSNQDLHATNLYNLTNFVAVVTGGGTGIGLMIAQTLAVNGATVYITGRRQDALDTVVENYSSKGSEHAGKIVGIAADVTDRASIEQLVKKVEAKEAGRGVHILVNNAGIAAEKQTTKIDSESPPDYKDPGKLKEWLMKADHQSWADTFNTNTTAAFFVSAAFLPLLGTAQKTTHGYSPVIVNVASVSGVLKASSGGQFAYAASKAALLELTRNLASTLYESRIRVNAIAPGVFPSEMTTSESDEKNKSSMEKSMENPSGRPGKDTDMANAVLGLVGWGSAYINGQVVVPDGGMTLTMPAASF